MKARFRLKRAGYPILRVGRQREVLSHIFRVRMSTHPRGLLVLPLKDIHATFRIVKGNA